MNDGGGGPGDAITRARADAHAGDIARARDRLRGYLVHRPMSREARLLLADLYRRDGHSDEAGRWGYLYPDSTSAAERAAYERACAHRMGRGWTSTYIRRGLHWPDGLPADDPAVQANIDRLDALADEERTDWLLRVNRPWMRWLSWLRSGRRRA